MRWWSWARRVETNDWRSLAYLYSAFSERSPWARATLISLGNSSWSSCSRAAISAFSFFLIFSARSIILGVMRERYSVNRPSRTVLNAYNEIIEDLREVSQMGMLRQGHEAPIPTVQAAEDSRWSRIARITISSTSAGCRGYRITSKAPRRVASRYSFHSPVWVVTTRRGCFWAVRDRDSSSR